MDVKSYALKSNLASLKTEVDKLDIDKLTPVPNDLAKLRNVVKNDVVKKTEYNKLIDEVDNIDTTGVVSKTKYEKDGPDFEEKINKVDKKIPYVNDLVKKTDFNSKVTEIEGKIPSITGLATNSALTAVENKIPNVSSLITHLDDKLKKNCDRVTSNISQHLLVENELKKLKKFDAAYFRGKNYFGGDGTQNYLVFQPMHKHFETFAKNNSTFIYSWESKGLSNEKISSINTSSFNSSPIFAYDNARIKVNFNRDFLKQDDLATYNHGKKVNIYIVYRLSLLLNDSIITLKKLSIWCC